MAELIVCGKVHFRNQPEEGCIPLTLEEIINGVCWIECPECRGTGIFEITEDYSMPCNYCKTKGKVPINC